MIIYRYNNFDIKQIRADTERQVIYTGISRATVTIALDYVSQNIYWTDPLHHHIAMRSVNTNETSTVKILISDNIEFPIAVAVDPNEG